MTDKKVNQTFISSVDNEIQLFKLEKPFISYVIGPLSERVHLRDTVFRVAPYLAVHVFCAIHEVVKPLPSLHHSIDVVAHDVLDIRYLGSHLSQPRIAPGFCCGCSTTRRVLIGSLKNQTQALHKIKNKISLEEAMQRPINC